MDLPASHPRCNGALRRDSLARHYTTLSIRIELPSEALSPIRELERSVNDNRPYPQNHLLATLVAEAGRPDRESPFLASCITLEMRLYAHLPTLQSETKTEVKVGWDGKREEDEVTAWHYEAFFPLMLCDRAIGVAQSKPSSVSILGRTPQLRDLFVMQGDPPIQGAGGKVCSLFHMHFSFLRTIIGQILKSQTSASILQETRSRSYVLRFQPENNIE